MQRPASFVHCLFVCFHRNQLSGILCAIPESGHVEAPDNQKIENNYLQEMVYHSHLWRWLLSGKIIITTLWKHNRNTINRSSHCIAQSCLKWFMSKPIS